MKNFLSGWRKPLPPKPRPARREYLPGEQEAGLIAILLGIPAGVQMHERYDAASDLEDFPSDAVVAALAQIASDPAQDDTLVDLCAESLAGIWVHRGAVDRELLARLTPWGRHVAERTTAHRTARENDADAVTPRQ